MRRLKYFCNGFFFPLSRVTGPGFRFLPFLVAERQARAECSCGNSVVVKAVQVKLAKRRSNWPSDFVAVWRWIRVVDVWRHNLARPCQVHNRKRRSCIFLSWGAGRRPLKTGREHCWKKNQDLLLQRFEKTHLKYVFKILGCQFSHLWCIICKSTYGVPSKSGYLAVSGIRQQGEKSGAVTYQ